MTNNVLSHSVDEVIQERNKRMDNYSYKLQTSGYGLDVQFGQHFDINENEMSVTIPFADGNRRDGVGDLLEVGGIDTERHRKNPIFLFDHGKQISLPVGKTEDPNTGEYTVFLDPQSKVASCKAFFYQGGSSYEHGLFCEQLFDLIAKKFIRAGSIGYLVKMAQKLPPQYETGTPQGLHLLSTLMLEASTVVLPANQDTIRKALCLSESCGKPLSPYLIKSLASYVDEAQCKVISGYESKAKQRPLSTRDRFAPQFTHHMNVENSKPIYAPHNRDLTEDQDRMNRYKEEDDVASGRPAWDQPHAGEIEDEEKGFREELESLPEIPAQTDRHGNRIDSSNEERHIARGDREIAEMGYDSPSSLMRDLQPADAGDRAAASQKLQEYHEEIKRRRYPPPSTEAQIRRAGQEVQKRRGNQEGDKSLIGNFKDFFPRASKGLRQKYLSKATNLPFDPNRSSREYDEAADHAQSLARHRLGVRLRQHESGFQPAIDRVEREARVRDGNQHMIAGPHSSDALGDHPASEHELRTRRSRQSRDAEKQSTERREQVAKIEEAEHRQREENPVIPKLKQERRRSSEEKALKKDKVAEQQIEDQRRRMHIDRRLNTPDFDNARMTENSKRTIYGPGGKPTNTPPDPVAFQDQVNDRMRTSGAFDMEPEEPEAEEKYLSKSTDDEEERTEQVRDEIDRGEREAGLDPRDKYTPEFSENERKQARDYDHKLRSGEIDEPVHRILNSALDDDRDIRRGVERDYSQRARGHHNLRLQEAEGATRDQIRERAKKSIQASPGQPYKTNLPPARWRPGAGAIKALRQKYGVKSASMNKDRRGDDDNVGRRYWELHRAGSGPATSDEIYAEHRSRVGTRYPGDTTQLSREEIEQAREISRNQDEALNREGRKSGDDIDNLPDEYTPEELSDLEAGNRRNREYDHSYLRRDAEALGDRSANRIMNVSVNLRDRNKKDIQMGQSPQIGQRVTAKVPIVRRPPGAVTGPPEYLQAPMTAIGPANEQAVAIRDSVGRVTNAIVNDEIAVEAPRKKLRGLQAKYLKKATNLPFDPNRSSRAYDEASDSARTQAREALQRRTRRSEGGENPATQEYEDWQGETFGHIRGPHDETNIQRHDQERDEQISYELSDHEDPKPQSQQDRERRERRDQLRGDRERSKVDQLRKDSDRKNFTTPESRGDDESLNQIEDQNYHAASQRDRDASTRDKKYRSREQETRKHREQMIHATDGPASVSQADNLMYLRRAEDNLGRQLSSAEREAREQIATSTRRRMKKPSEGKNFDTPESYRDSNRLMNLGVNALEGLTEEEYQRQVRGDKKDRSRNDERHAIQDEMDNRTGTVAPNQATNLMRLRRSENAANQSLSREERAEREEIAARTRQRMQKPESKSIDEPDNEIKARKEREAFEDFAKRYPPRDARRISIDREGREAIDKRHQAGQYSDPPRSVFSDRIKSLRSKYRVKSADSDTVFVSSHIRTKAKKKEPPSFTPKTTEELAQRRRLGLEHERHTEETGMWEGSRRFLAENPEYFRDPKKVSEASREYREVTGKRPPPRRSWEDFPEEDLPATSEEEQKSFSKKTKGLRAKYKTQRYPNPSKIEPRKRVARASQHDADAANVRHIQARADSAEVLRGAFVEASKRGSPSAQRYRGELIDEEEVMDEDQIRFRNRQRETE